MNRSRWIIGGATAAVILASSVGLGLTMARTTSTDAATGPAQGPTASGTPTSSPTPSVSSAPTATPAGPAAIDPAYGDVVVETAADGSAATATGLTVELVSLTETEVTGTGIGSTSGPAVEVSVRVTNTSGAPVTLAPAVNAYAGAQRMPLTPDHETPVASTLAAGEASVGSYTFAVEAADTEIWITVSTSAESGLVVFEYDR